MEPSKVANLQTFKNICFKAEAMVFLKNYMQKGGPFE